jgi:hypothetical protein
MIERASMPTYRRRGRGDIWERMEDNGSEATSREPHLEDHRVGLGFDGGDTVAAASPNWAGWTTYRWSGGPCGVWVLRHEDGQTRKKKKKKKKRYTCRVDVKMVEVVHARYTPLATRKNTA